VTMADFNSSIIEEFRANEGKVGGPFQGAPVLLLTTTGAKTGRRHTTPVVYLEDGGQRYVFASKAGAPNHPDWYFNLVANPVVTVEVGPDTFEAKATPVTGEERDRLFDRQKEVMPGFAEYEDKTTRVIPVVLLQPVD